MGPDQPGRLAAFRPKAALLPTRPMLIDQLEGDRPLEFPCRGLFIQASAAPNGRVLDNFFDGYDSAFVLPNEKEERSGFIECLALNFGTRYRRLARKFGPFREMILVAWDASRETRSLIGGA